MNILSNKYLWQYLPTLGCCVFLILIVITSINYPGGSQVDESAVGYSWVNNYLCDVIANVSYNDTPHPYYKMGLAAMISLCAGISMFFFFFTDWLAVKGMWKPIIKWMGFASMICAMLIFTDLHNIMIAVASILALPALIGVFVILYQKKIMKAFYLGIVVLVLLFFNNVIYYTDFMVSILAQLQKLSCLTVVVWIVYMNRKLISLNRST